MKFLKGLAKRFSGLNADQKSYLTLKLNEYGFGESNSDYGAVTTVEKGLKQPTVYTCIERISSKVADTPLLVLMKDEEGSNRARQHSVYRLLNTKANTDQTAYTWKRLTAVHLLGWGNAFSYIERSNRGQVIGLNPMHPADVKIEGRTSDGQLLYSWTDKNNKIFYFPDSDILHVRGLSFDGIIGCSPITHQQALIGRARVREEFASRFYRNGAQLGGVITAPDGVTEEQLAELRKSFQETYSGPKNAGKVLLLEGSQKFDPVGISPKDAEFVDSMKLDAASIAALFGCPLQLINDVETTTRASAEELFRQFLMLGLNPVFSNIEAEINVKLFTRAEQDIYYAEFLRESLIEADFQTKIDGLQKQVMAGMMTPNQARAKLNLNPMPFGDKLLVPVNVTTLENILAPRDVPQLPPAAPTPTAPTPTRSERTEDLAVKERSRNGRKHLMKSTNILLRDAFDRVGKRERQDLSRMVMKNLRDADSFKRALEDYYNQSSPFSVYFNSVLKPILASLSESLRHQIQGELGKSIEDDNTSFNSEYLNALLFRYTASSRRQLEGLLEDLTEDQDPADIIEQRLTEWAEGTTSVNPNRVEKEAEREANRMTNALTRFFLVAGGVTRLVWNTTGGGCPICDELDGKVVGVEDTFVRDGDGFANGFKASGDHFNPPLHSGCNCVVNPA